MKDLPLKECIVLSAAEMQIWSLMTTETPRTTPCKIVFMFISHHFCNILDLSRMPMSLRPRSG